MESHEPPQMPLDHYISQVHLKNFYSPALGERMHAMRKPDLTYYPCNSSSQCRVEGGSTNAYLLEDRAIEAFLKTIENKYNGALENLTSGKIINSETIYSIAGFIAYVMTCSPAAMRINAEFLRGTVEMTIALMEKRGELPPPPPELGGKTLSELMQSGVVKPVIDEKYPQAIGISGILDHVATFGNFDWDILLNEHVDCPFVTSDYPIASEQAKDPRLLNRIVPIAPHLAIRIRPTLEIDSTIANFSFKYFRYRHIRVPRHEVISINRLLIRSAETTVYFRDDSEIIRTFIEKNRFFRAKSRNIHVPSKSGVMQITQNVVESHRWT